MTEKIVCPTCGTEKNRKAYKCHCPVCKLPSRKPNKQCKCNRGYCSWCGKYKWLEEGKNYCPACAEDDLRIQIELSNARSDKWSKHYRDGKGKWKNEG